MSLGAMLKEILTACAESNVTLVVQVNKDGETAKPRIQMILDAPLKE